MASASLARWPDPGQPARYPDRERADTRDDSADRGGSSSSFWSGRRVLVTGGHGFLGRTVARKLQERAPGEIILPRSNEYDLRQLDDVERMFADHSPDLVIHLAAR